MRDFIMISVSLSPAMVFVIGGVLVKKSERKRWNNGYCPECGLKWIHYDTDSQGGRMYRCNNWHYCNVSYNVDKENVNNKGD